LGRAQPLLIDANGAFAPERRVQAEVRRPALAEVSVLYADGDPITRKRLAGYLRQRARVVHVAADGMEALTLFEAHRPDVVVTDIGMPRMDGLALVRAVKARDAATPIVVTSANSDSTHLLQAIDLGVERYVLKPVDTGKLVAALEFCARAAHSARSLRLAQAIVESVSDALAILDADGRICSVNPAFARLTGWGGSVVAGRPLADLLAGADLDLRVHLRSRSLSSWRGEFWLRKADGAAFWALGSLDPVPADGYGGDLRVFKFFDHTETRRAHEEIRRLAYHDPLTGLPNRLLADEATRETLAEAEATGRSFALLFIDVDRFKAVNDMHGHDVGDAVLREMGRRIAASVRAGDLVSRRGGDEFLVLLREVTDPDEAEAVAARVRAAMIPAIAVENRALEVGCSVGVAVYPLHGACPMELLRHADRAMYVAKAGACEHAGSCDELASCGGKRPQGRTPAGDPVRGANHSAGTHYASDCRPAHA
jgi:diguanylate cyclase (GGDEF)-like protein/PAS domain S-box-containing protein